MKLKNLIIGDLDNMFLESFCKFLSENYQTIMFAAVGDDSMIHLINAFASEKELKEFITELENNPYVQDIQKIKFKGPVKGQKIFNFPENIILDKQDGELFDNGEEDEGEDEDMSEEIEIDY
ncbi:MAG: hypothetical protein ACFFCS_06725 [Candidatus Hodarchaeota archaeon]